MKRALAIAVGLALALGCNLLLDVGDHHLRADSVATGSTGGVTSAMGGGGGASGGGSVGSGGACDGGQGGSMRGTPVVIASGQVHPTVIRVDAMYVYWINEATGGSPGAVMRAPKNGLDGCSAVETLAADLGNPVGLWKGKPGGITPALFFTDDSGRLPNGPGLYRVLNEGAEVGTIQAVDTGDGFGATLLWAHAFQFAYTAAPSGAQSRIRKSLMGMTGAPGNCYPYTGAPNDGDIAALGASTNYVYFSHAGSSSVLRTPTFACDADAGSAEIFAQNPDGTQTRAIFVGKNVTTVPEKVVVFWVTGNDVLKRYEDEPETVVLVSGQKGPRDLRLLDAWVYFTNEDDGSVRRVNPRTMTGDAEDMALGQGGPHSLADDGATLYWTNYDSGQIVRYDPP